jgi:hypothetical protein
MNDYQKEQFHAFDTVQKYLKGLENSKREALTISVNDYLDFRSEVDVFLSTH